MIKYIKLFSIFIVVIFVFCITLEHTKAYNTGCNYTIPFNTSQNMVLAGPSGSNYDYWIVNDLSGKYCPHPDGMLAHAILPVANSIKYNKIVPLAYSQYVSDHYGSIQYENDDEGNDRLNGSFFLSSGLDSSVAYYTNCKTCPDSGIGRAEDCEWHQSLQSYLPHYEGATEFHNPLWPSSLVYYYPAGTICGNTLINSSNNPPEVALPGYSTSGSNTMEFWIHDLAGGNIGPVKIFKLYKAPANPPGSFTLNKPDGCNYGAVCNRTITLYWGVSQYATYYKLQESTNGGASYHNISVLGVGNGNITSTFATLTNDNGKTDRIFRVVAYNTIGSKVSNGATADACNPTIKTFTLSCASETSRKLTFSKCFSDNNYTLERSDCDRVPGTYSYSDTVTYDNADPSEQDVRNVLSSIVDVNKITQIQRTKNNTIKAVVQLYDSTLEQAIRDALRSFGHLKENIVRGNFPAKCPLDNCTNPSTINNNINGALTTYNDNSIIPDKPANYTLSINGTSASKVIEGVECKNTLQGLTIQYDPSITKNPPPGFADLFAPIFKEIVP